MPNTVKIVVQGVTLIACGEGDAQGQVQACVGTVHHCDLVSNENKVRFPEHNTSDEFYADHGTYVAESLTIRNANTANIVINCALGLRRSVALLIRVYMDLESGNFDTVFTAVKKCIKLPRTNR